jgi:hypothetical protein
VTQNVLCIWQPAARQRSGPARKEIKKERIALERTKPTRECLLLVIAGNDLIWDKGMFAQDLPEHQERHGVQDFPRTWSRQALSGIINYN